MMGTFSGETALEPGALVICDFSHPRDVVHGQTPSSTEKYLLAKVSRCRPTQHQFETLEVSSGKKRSWPLPMAYTAAGG